jgi:hypothetical protein
MYQPIQDRGLAGLGDSYAWQRPGRTIPSGAQRERAASLRAQLEAADGEVLALHRPWWSVLAGGEGHVGSMGINDVPDTEAEAIRDALREGVREGRYAAIWLEGEPPRWMRRVLAQRYVLAQRRQGKQRVRPMSGYMSVAGMVTPYRNDQLSFTLPSARPVPEGATVLGDFEDRSLRGWTTRGRAFGRRPVRSIWRDLPPVGPIGGEGLLSSAASSAGVKAVGEAHSPAFEVAAGGHIEMLLGAVGPRDALQVELTTEDGGSRLEIETPRGRWRLSPVSVEVPAEMAGRPLVLHLSDDGEKSALFVDDVWLVQP